MPTCDECKDTGYVIVPDASWEDSLERCMACYLITEYEIKEE